MQQTKTFEDKFQRILEAAGIEKDADLARVLGIKPQSIAAARKRKQIPSGWVEKIAEKFNVSADWLFFGTGPMQKNAPDGAPANDSGPNASDVLGMKQGDLPPQPGEQGQSSPLAADVERITAILERIGTPEPEIRQAILEVIKAHQPAPVIAADLEPWRLAKEPSTKYGRDPDDEDDQ